MPITVTARRKVIACRKFCLSRYQPSEYLLIVGRVSDPTFIVRLCLKADPNSQEKCSVPRYDPVRSVIRCQQKTSEGTTRLILVAVRETFTARVTLAPNGVAGEAAKPFPGGDRSSWRRGQTGLRP